jgi:hypothetical protein
MAVRTSATATASAAAELETRQQNDEFISTTSVIPCSVRHM